MKLSLVLGAFVALLGGALAPPARAASAPAIFYGALACTVRPAGDSTAGQRWCQGDGLPKNISTIPSFDGTPIDVAVSFPPAPTTGPDGHFPVVAVFHGYGGSKILGSDVNYAQRFLKMGYAVFSITDRGFGGSCGPAIPDPKPASCAKGYVHMVDSAYEVRDVQRLLGVLADEGDIDPNRVGAYGESYGGGQSMQVATLNDRTVLTDGTT
ncbi:MAG: acetylxylan esterase, partial [Solirubrobacteraceae bacterium]|nr:acetylxylan esterase [Patulibacter sp.]